MIASADIAAIAAPLLSQDSADRLVELANQRSGPENIAVVVACWVYNPSAENPPDGEPCQCSTRATFSKADTWSYKR